MYPKLLLADIPWSFNDDTYESVDAFVKAVSDYHAALELPGEWKSSDIALNASKLNIASTRIYDKNDNEVDLSFAIVANGPSFTNGELLRKLHNAYADKLLAGLKLGDHCFFEGLTYCEGSEGQYKCSLGS